MPALPRGRLSKKRRFRFGRSPRACHGPPDRRETGRTSKLQDEIEKKNTHTHTPRAACPCRSIPPRPHKSGYVCTFRASTRNETVIVSKGPRLSATFQKARRQRHHAAEAAAAAAAEAAARHNRRRRIPFNAARVANVFSLLFGKDAFLPSSVVYFRANSASVLLKLSAAVALRHWKIPQNSTLPTQKKT